MERNLVFSIPSGSYTLPLLQAFLSSEGKILMGTFPLELCVPSCGSLYSFPSAAGKIFSDYCWIKYWSIRMAEYHQESFYHYLLCIYLWTVVFDFTLNLGYLVSVSWLPKQCCTWVWSLGMGLKSNQTLVGYSYNLCVTIALAYFAGRRGL